ncbi:MAG: DUF2950 family protein [Planctomycetota bacterium]|nr:DUF2950 family protein [Planctomycetota bacterium]
MNKIRANDVLLSLAFLAIVAAVGLPGLIHSDQVRNERTACAALDSIVSAERVFFHQDLDRNGIRDYWSRDIKGLQTITKNILSQKLALADRAPIQDLGEQEEETSPEAYSGYWFQAVGGKEDRSGFRYAALPSRYKSGGQYVFLVDESRRLIRKDYGEAVVGRGNQPTLTKIWTGEWPSDKERTEEWTQTP